jgi:hypothetical protein
MIIKLTNIAKEFEGPLLINVKHIMSVFSETKDVDGAIEITTVVYSVTKEGWNVRESVNEIYDLIKEGIQL